MCVCVYIYFIKESRSGLPPSPQVWHQWASRAVGRDGNEPSLVQFEMMDEAASIVSRAVHKEDEKEPSPQSLCLRIDEQHTHTRTKILQKIGGKISNNNSDVILFVCVCSFSLVSIFFFLSGFLSASQSQPLCLSGL